MKKNRQISIGEAAEKLGVNKDTLRNWDENGKLTPVRTAGGHRRYKLSDVEEMLGSKTIEERVAELEERVKKLENN